MFQRARFISPNLNAWCLCLVSSIVKLMQCGHARLRMRKGVTGHVSRLNEFHGQIKSNEVNVINLYQTGVCVCACVFSKFQDTLKHRTSRHHSADGDNRCRPGRRHSRSRHCRQWPSQTCPNITFKIFKKQISYIYMYCIKNLWRSLRRSFKCWIAFTETLPNCPNPNDGIDIHRHTEHGFPVEWQAFFWQASKAFFSASAKLSLCAKGLNKNTAAVYPSRPQ